MANFSVAKPLILALEGGLSNNPNDNAAKHPAPNGYHTNKGITWQTFQSFAKPLGYTADLATFMAMPDSIVFGIAKKGFWDTLKLDSINTNKKAYLAFDFSFNSGPETAIKQIQQALGITVDGIAGPQFINAMNKASETEIAHAITKQRVSFIENSTRIAENLKSGLVARAELLLKKKFQLT